MSKVVARLKRNDCANEGVRSSRKLETLIKNDMGAIWLTGRNEPDPNTLWRFFQDNGKAITALVKQLEFSPYHETMQRARERTWNHKGIEKLKRRGEIVEPAFGGIKHNEGFRRFTARGLEMDGAQWAMICTTCNLRTLLRIWAKKKWVFG